MKLYVTMALVGAVIALAAAGALLLAGRRTEGKVTAAAIAGGMGICLVMFALCLAYFTI